MSVGGTPFSVWVSTDGSPRWALDTWWDAPRECHPDDMSRRLATVLMALCGLWLAIYEVRVVAFPGWHLVPFGRGAHLIELGVASALCMLRAITDRRERAGWFLIGLGCASWTLGETYFTADLWNLQNIPVPSWADVGYLAFPPLVFAGIVLLARQRIRGMSASVWIDGAAAALAVAGLSAALVFGPVLRSVGGTPANVATNLAYPLADLLLLGLLVGVVALSGWRLTRTWLLLGMGVVVFCVADSLYLVQSAHGSYIPGGVYDTGWWGGITLLAAAAWIRGGDRRDQSAAEQTILLPLAFGVVALGVLIVGDLRSGPMNPLAVTLAGGSLTAIGIRLLLTFRHSQRILSDSRKAALTDSLTGLPNRRALTDDLAAVMRVADRTRPVVLALFDLDGFKQYNDTFGHPAGDALLARLADRLRRSVDGSATPYRMGGDEFCVLGVIDGTGTARAAAALTEKGEAFTIGCSYGVASLPEEASSAAAALHLADQRMYDHKTARASASRQSTDVLLKVLGERNPGLLEHLGEVSVLATMTAEALGLSEHEVKRIEIAAELHDVGKVAIPDTILNKPGPLDEEEWAFMRSHTEIGARIVNAAPSLARSAELVRASHERYDGCGYPDRLAGEEIPLGAGIIAVCDAFDAMTSDRSYRRAIAVADAVAELRRCSGSQFDPRVVDAFCELIADPNCELHKALVLDGPDPARPRTGV
jgi:two-component system, cell cycle response regulator